MRQIAEADHGDDVQGFAPAPVLFTPQPVALLRRAEAAALTDMAAGLSLLARAGTARLAGAAPPRLPLVSRLRRRGR